jgi:phosphatidylserine synthase
MRAGTPWRWAANTATLLNGACGAGAIAYVILGNVPFALFLVLAGVGFDGLDGIFSRRSRLPPRVFGRIADSCADAVTFCLAPGLAVAYPQGLGGPWPTWQNLAYVVGGAIAVVGIARLVYYTTVAYARPHFTGASTPQNAMLVILLLLLFRQPAFLGANPPLLLLPALLMVPVMVLPLAYPKARKGSPLRTLTGAMAACLSLSLVVINFRPAPGGQLYDLSFTGAVVATLLLAGFYLLGPWVARSGARAHAGENEMGVD